MVAQFNILMHTAEPLIIPQADLARIERMAGAARGDRQAERDLYFAIKSLPADQQAELLALVMLGRAGHRSFNLALASAKAQNPAHVAGMLTEKSNLQASLTQGLKRYARQS